MVIILVDSTSLCLSMLLWLILSATDYRFCLEKDSRFPQWESPVSMGRDSKFSYGDNPVSRLPQDLQFQQTLFWFQLAGLYNFYAIFFQMSLLHRSVVPYWVVFCDIIRQVFLYFSPEYVEMILIAYPIKYHVYCSGYFLLFCSIQDYIFHCMLSCHWFWWLLVTYFFQASLHGCFILTISKKSSPLCFIG